MTVTQFLKDLDGSAANLRILFVAGDFRQAKLWFEKVERIVGGQTRRGIDKWELKYKGHTITAVPLTQHIRGYRPNAVMICGEISEIHEEEWKNFLQPFLQPFLSVNPNSTLFPAVSRVFEEELPKSLEERIETLEGLVKQLQNKI